MIKLYFNLSTILHNLFLHYSHTVKMNEVYILLNFQIIELTSQWRLDLLLCYFAVASKNKKIQLIFTNIFILTCKNF